MNNFVLVFLQRIQNEYIFENLCSKFHNDRSTRSKVSAIHSASLLVGKGEVQSQNRFIACFWNVHGSILYTECNGNTVSMSKM